MKDKQQFWQAVKFTLFSISAGVIQVGSFAVVAVAVDFLVLVRHSTSADFIIQCHITCQKFNDDTT